MYSHLIASGAVPGGYTNATLQDFCWTRMFEDLGAEGWVWLLAHAAHHMTHLTVGFARRDSMIQDIGGGDHCRNAPYEACSESNNCFHQSTCVPDSNSEDIFCGAFNSSVSGLDRMQPWEVNAAVN
jgi:hypothetical protein